MGSRRHAKAALLAAIVAVTIGSAGIGRQEAGAAGNGNATTGATEQAKWHFDDGFRDPGTGWSFFRAYAYDKNSFESRVVYKNTKDEWYALPQRYLTVGTDYETGKIMLSDYISLEGNIYEPAKGLVTHEILFDDVSPDGKYSLKLGEHYTVFSDRERTMTGKQLLVFVKNNATGVVRKSAYTAFYSGAAWLNDNRLLAHVYSEEEHQNVILAIDPATGAAKTLVSGSLEGLDVAGGYLRFTYNEPTRKPWVYNLADGSIRPYVEATDRQRFEGQAVPQPKVPAAIDASVVPADLQPDSLPVAALQERSISEATAVVNSIAVALPSAFMEGNKAWLALQPFQAALGVSVKKQAENDFAGSFEVSYRGKTITLDETNSRNYGGRLFADRSALAKLGLRLQSLTWHA